MLSYQCYTSSPLHHSSLTPYEGQVLLFMGKLIFWLCFCRY